MTRGFSVLRFNFRGVGKSQGEFDSGIGELADAATALDWLQSKNPTAAQWAAALQPVRQPLGPVTSRVLLGEAKASNLQGAPAGEYDTLRFQTSFANMQGATETVIMVRQSGGWKVIGYFIR